MTARRGQREQQEAYYRNKGYGLDWAALKKAHDERLEAEIARGVDNEQTRAIKARRAGVEPEPLPPVRPSVNKKPKAERKPNPIHTPHLQQPELLEPMVALYKEGAKVRDIAEKFGLTESTVRRYLKWADVFIPFRDGTAAKRDRCVYGHLLTDDNIFIWKKQDKNGKVYDVRGCKACRRRQNREYWKRKQDAKRAS